MRGLLGKQTASGARRQALTHSMPPRTSALATWKAPQAPMDPGLQAGALLPSPPSSGGGLLRLRWDSPLSSMR